MPTNPSGSPLEAALSYYSSIVTLNAEGDSMVTEETLEGIGTTGFLLHALFGSILRLAQPAPPDPSPKLDQTGPPTATSPATNPSSQPTLSSRKPPISSQLKPPLDGDASATANSTNMAAAYANPPQPAAGSVQDTIQQATGSAVRGLQGMTAPGTSFGGESSSDYGDDFLDIHDHHPQLQLREIDDECEDELTKSRLTQYLPEPGYFLAGALAGGISRTATAPLDRLKVYLLVNTKTKAGVAADVVKQGQPLAAVRTAGKPIGDAIHALWKAGGFRTFFAGKQRLIAPCAIDAELTPPPGNGLNVIKIMPETAIKVRCFIFFRRQEGFQLTAASLARTKLRSALLPPSKAMMIQPGLTPILSSLPAAWQA